MDWPEDAEPVYMGVLHSKTIWGKEAFLYDLSSTYKCNFLGADNKQ